MSPDLKHRVESHDWRSLRVYDLEERLVLVNELKVLPFKKIAKVIEGLKPEIKVIAMKTITMFKGVPLT